jgi:hypothetical protein
VLKTIRFTLGILAVTGALAAHPVIAMAQETPRPASRGDADPGGRGREHIGRMSLTTPRLSGDVTGSDIAERSCATTERQVLGSRDAAIVWARGNGGQSLTQIPSSDGQSHYLVDLVGGSLELIGPEHALQRISWMGDSSESREWSSFIDRYAAGQTGFVTDVLADTTSETPDESVDLADRTLHVMAIRASAGTLLVLAVKDAVDRAADASEGSSFGPGLGAPRSGTACRVLA